MNYCTSQNKAINEVVEVYDEPKHKLVFQKGEIKILDLQLMPHDTTLFHIHKNPIFYVSLGWQKDSGQPLNGEWDSIPAPEWPKGEVESDTGYATNPVIHRATNCGEIKSRLIGIINSGKGMDNGYNSEGFEIANKWFRSGRLLLNKGDTLISVKSDFPVVLVFVSGSSYRLIQSDQTEIQDKEWLYLEDGFLLINTGDEELEVIRIEVLH